MERENYYLLLELSVDPPEEDPNIINAAIKKKQTQWSRYRNHPTKSIQAKQYIGMIPDIRKVLADPELRRKEVEEAKEFLKNKEADKFSKLDRHIALLMSKGTLTKTEIAGLAKMDSISEEDIRERIKKNEKVFKIDRELHLLMSKGPVSDKKIAKFSKLHAIGDKKIRELIKKNEEEKFAEIDTYIKACTERGYITEEAIEKLAKIFGIKENLILNRIECPIKAEEAEDKLKRPKPLDKTLEKLISDNLKIVGNSSLYEFLEVSPDSELEFIQVMAKEKEMEIRKIGQKDAIMTAGGVLAGHCIVIFNSKRSRNAYDLTLKWERLKELDSDIDVAGIDKKIRGEYFEFLVRKALRLGMDIDEAFDYIYDYCEKEKWAVEEKKRLIAIKKKKIILKERWSFELNPKKPSFWALIGGVVVAFFIIITSINLVGNAIQAARLSRAYGNVLTTLKHQQELEKKEKVLKDFLDNYGETKYAPELRDKIKEIRKNMEKRDYELTLQNIKKLDENKNFEEMTVAYQKYLDKYPNSSASNEIRKAMAKIPELIDDRDFDLLKGVANADYTERIKAYTWYLKNHPEGRHLEDVRKLFLSMISQYYNILKQDLEQCEADGAWEKCIQLCTNFIEKFQGTDEADLEVAGLKIKYEKRLEYEYHLSKMREAEETVLRTYDFKTAKRIYSDYLEGNPELPAYMKEMVSNELARVEAAHQKYLQEEEEWEKLRVYLNDTLPRLSEKIGKAKEFIQKNPSGRYIDEAKEKLNALEKEYEKWLMAKQEEEYLKQWGELVKYFKNPKLSLSNKIEKVEQFIRKYPGGSYSKNATEMLTQLKEEKAKEDEQKRKEKERLAAIEKEKDRILSLIKDSRGRYKDNRNGTITDTKTGLTWTVLDSFIEIGECVDYQVARDYVSALKTGGYNDWRLPTVNELVSIYKAKPFFPSSNAKWYWSSDIVWHGWNKMVNIVTTVHETVWHKDQLEPTQCGAVRAVRK